VVLSVVALCTAALVAIGMVAWHQHYLTDAIGGAVIGIGVTLAVALLIDVVGDRRARRLQPGPAARTEPTRQLS
jgi:membrane-associated phospholipid phosphatase